MTGARRLGLFGGTFDPIHYGHLDAADAARSALSLDRILFIPAHDPPHRSVDPRASAYHRFAMTALAINEHPGCAVSDVELSRDSASYTVETLRAFQAAGWRSSQLFFILGADAFAEIATWKEFPGVLDASHFIVIARPGTTLEAAASRTPEILGRMDRPEPGPAQTAGSTRIFLVQAATRDVSSTAIRERLAARLRIDDLVPPSVERHILTHHLYGSVGGLHDEDGHEDR